MCEREREGEGERVSQRGRGRKRDFEAVGLVKQRLTHTCGLTLPWLSTQELTAVALRV